MLIEWAPPSGPGGPAIDEYHVRYIWAGAAGLADHYWTIAGRARRDISPVQVITGLEPGLGYAVQVRSAGSAGVGEWSDAVLLGPVIGPGGPAGADQAPRSPR